MRKRLLAVLLMGVLTSCEEPSQEITQTPPSRGAWHHATERPYVIFGKYYTPQLHYTYSAIGVASWYGSECQGNCTAMGTRFDMNRPSAAHRTLPLPCVARVTNLDNGRSMLILINDRGPYVDTSHRIIDLSARAAQLLGYYGTGLARIRVDCLPEESVRVASAYRRRPYGVLVSAPAPEEADTPPPQANTTVATMNTPPVTPQKVIVRNITRSEPQNRKITNKKPKGNLIMASSFSGYKKLFDQKPAVQNSQIVHRKIAIPSKSSVTSHRKKLNEI